LALLVWGFKDQIEAVLKGKPEPQKVEVVNLPRDMPVLTLTPLPHYRGYMLPPEYETKDIGNGVHRSTMKPQLNTTVEARLMSSSQHIQIFSGPLTGPYKELIVKFGVIRVHCIGGDAIGCKVEAKVNLIEQFGKPYHKTWYNVGYVNWFSLALRNEFIHFFEGEEKPKGMGLNQYLKNTVEDLHYDEEKDLLLFYMIKDMTPVFLCTDAEGAPVGYAVEDKPVRFEIELSIRAEKYPRTTFRYLVSAKWDNYEIQQT